MRNLFFAALADYEVPERFEIVSESHRSSLGKIKRKLLRATMAFIKPRKPRAAAITAA